MNVLIVINDAPYGTEKAYNALRMAMALQKGHKDVEVRIFLLADAVECAIPNQETPWGYYNVERMLKSVLKNGGKVKSCGENWSPGSRLTRYAPTGDERLWRYFTCE